MPALRLHNIKQILLFDLQDAKKNNVNILDLTNSNHWIIALLRILFYFWKLCAWDTKERNLPNSSSYEISIEVWMSMAGKYAETCRSVKPE